MALNIDHQPDHNWKPDETLQKMLEYYVEQICAFTGVNPNDSRKCTDASCSGSHVTGPYLMTLLYAVLTSHSHLQYSRLRREVSTSDQIDDLMAAFNKKQSSQTN